MIIRQNQSIAENNEYNVNHLRPYKIVLFKN